MQDFEPIVESRSMVSGAPGGTRRRAGIVPIVLAVLSFLVLILLLPPLINVSRFQRRIASSLSTSLGRPVHIDRISMNVLPIPGFTLENFAVSEDPAFGSEPVIRANTVKANLRFRSLLRGRIEFARISFTEPSVNLVHSAQGKWNVESILLQAARIKAAPTSQAEAGPAPRFPYIEASGARLNFKNGIEKLPFSFTEADFALWLPNPEQWRLRLEARPSRTDTDATGTEPVRLEATFGRAATLSEVPIALTGEWRNVPLGETSRIVMGRDINWRGQMTLRAEARGTVGNNSIHSSIVLEDARRADFVPDKPLSATIDCQLAAASLFHTLSDVHCRWPLGGSRDPEAILLSGEWTDIRRPETLTFTATSDAIPAAVLLQWARIGTPRLPRDLSATGSFAGEAHLLPAAGEAPRWTGELHTTSGVINGAAIPSVQPAGIAVGELDLRPALRTVKDPHPDVGFLLGPARLALGGKEPALLTGVCNGQGYTLHLHGSAASAVLRALGASVPQFGDGLDAVLEPADAASSAVATRVDLTSTRLWGAPQVWTRDTVRPPPRTPKRGHRRR